MSGPDEAAGQPNNCPWRQDVTGIIGNMVPVNSGFHARKNFSENYPQFGHSLSGRKSLKRSGFKWCQIISLPATPNY
jgi:hypothetical protein